MPRAIPLTCAPLAVLPTCSGDVDLGQRDHQRCGPRRRRVRRAVQPRVRRARRKHMPKGGRRAGGGGSFLFYFSPVQCLTPPVCAFCVSRGRDGGGGSGPSTVSTRALVAAGSAASGGGAGGGSPCGLRPVLIPPGAPRDSQAPRAAWACARHAPQTLGGVGACYVGFLCSVGRLRAYLGDFGAAHRPPTVKRKKNLSFGGSAGGYPVRPWGFGVGGCTPPSAYLVVCAKLRPFGAFQFLPKLPLNLGSKSKE